MGTVFGNSDDSTTLTSAQTNSFNTDSSITTPVTGGIGMGANILTTQGGIGTVTLTDWGAFQASASLATQALQTAKSATDVVTAAGKSAIETAAKTVQEKGESDITKIFKGGTIFIVGVVLAGGLVLVLAYKLFFSKKG